MTDWAILTNPFFTIRPALLARGQGITTLIQEAEALDLLGITMPLQVRVGETFLYLTRTDEGWTTWVETDQGDPVIVTGPSLVTILQEVANVLDR